MNIVKNIETFIWHTGPLDRNASFDYCFNYFQSFRDQNQQHILHDREYILESCLHLGFYLASWGMLRGSSTLLQKSIKVFEPVIQNIALIDADFWDIDAHSYTPDNIDALLKFGSSIREVLMFEKEPTDTLITKIMLGVFGNVPAFDTFFCKGLKVSYFGRNALKKIGEFYNENNEIIEKSRLYTLDFHTGQRTTRLYTRAKMIDIIFFTEGSNK